MLAGFVLSLEQQHGAQREEGRLSAVHSTRASGDGDGNGNGKKTLLAARSLDDDDDDDESLSISREELRSWQLSAFFPVYPPAAHLSAKAFLGEPTSGARRLRY